MESFRDLYNIDVCTEDVPKLFFYSVQMVPYPDNNLYDKSQSIFLNIFYRNVFVRNQE